jgi:hypothetical protein
MTTNEDINSLDQNVSSTEIIKLVQALYIAFAKKDINSILSMLSEEVEWGLQPLRRQVARTRRFFKMVGNRQAV